MQEENAFTLPIWHYNTRSIKQQRNRLMMALQIRQRLKKLLHPQTTKKAF